MEHKFRSKNLLYLMNNMIQNFKLIIIVNKIKEYLNFVVKLNNFGPE